MTIPTAADAPGPANNWNRPEPPMPPIAHAARIVARQCKAKAKELDEAFLKRADPRAVQGGAICEEAHEWRDLAERLFRITLEIQELEA